MKRIIKYLVLIPLYLLPLAPANSKDTVFVRNSGRTDFIPASDLKLRTYEDDSSLNSFFGDTFSYVGFDDYRDPEMVSIPYIFINNGSTFYNEYKRELLQIEGIRRALNAYTESLAEGQQLEKSIANLIQRAQNLQRANKDKTVKLKLDNLNSLFPIKLKQEYLHDGDKIINDLKDKLPLDIYKQFICYKTLRRENFRRDSQLSDKMKYCFNSYLNAPGIERNVVSNDIAKLFLLQNILKSYDYKYAPEKFVNKLVEDLIPWQVAYKSQTDLNWIVRFLNFAGVRNDTEKKAFLEKVKKNKESIINAFGSEIDKKSRVMAKVAEAAKIPTSLLSAFSISDKQELIFDESKIKYGANAAYQKVYERASAAIKDINKMTIDEVELLKCDVIFNENKDINFKSKVSEKLKTCTQKITESVPSLNDLKVYQTESDNAIALIQFYLAAKNHESLEELAEVQFDQARDFSKSVFGWIYDKPCNNCTNKSEIDELKEKIRESKDLSILFDIIKTNQIEVAKALNKLPRDLQKYVSALTFKVHDNKIYFEFDNDKMYKILLRKDILKKIVATKAHIDTLPGSFILEVGKPIVEEMVKVTDGETDLTQEAKGQSRNIGSKEAQRVQQN